VGDEALVHVGEVIEEDHLSIFFFILYPLEFHTRHCAPQSDIVLVGCDESVRGWVVLKGYNLLIGNVLLEFFVRSLELEGGGCSFDIGCSFEDDIDIPACHHAILIAGCDHPGHLVVVLGVRKHPSDRLCVVPLHCLCGYASLRRAVASVKDFKTTITHSHAYFILGVHAHLSNVLLIEVFFSSLLDCI
jgi:hypothetical protein